MRTKLASRVLGVLLIVAMLLSVVPALASSSGDPTDTLPVDADLEASEPVGEVYQVTLITGDVVTVTINGSGQRSFTISPADPTKLGQHFLTIEQQGDTYIIPDGIDLEKLDMELFNINYLVDEQYYEQASLPLLVSYLPSLTVPQVRALEDKVSALGQGTEGYDEVFTITTQLAYENISRSYSSLISQPEVDKIWLDKKVHAQLMDSVPLIGAPSWWNAGYNGTGVAIAILDTGIDSSHPALDDLDDNVSTNDSKVVTNINFTDDTNFDDLFGHGTHVAGIAAGTAAGSNYTGVAPGAQLWNVKVLNQYGWGYWSWVINGINFASLGPDSVPGTGDEADIISMSLGGGVSDGTDPVSQAVNLAVERGVVVAVAAGNSGYGGMFTITTPGVAEKVITVGASDKQDILASFSSRGPTVDMRIKPDIVAPGVDIISSVPTSPDSVINDPSGYKDLSGTSMATPHVAGAAALLLQYYGDNATPQLIKDRLMSTARDLGYSVYDQGAGRLDLITPQATGGPAELAWSAETIPTVTDKVIEPATINDYAIAADGKTIYAALTGNKLYKSTDAGVKWTALTSPLTNTANLVAIAPGNDSIVVVVGTDSTGALEVWISINAGSSFTNLGTPTNATGTEMTAVSALAISPMVAGVANIALGGAIGANPAVCYFNYGAVIPRWVNAAANTPGDWTENIGAGATAVRAVAFSPSFAADRIMGVVTENGNGVQFQIGSFATKMWNASISSYVGYPVSLIIGVTALTADLALAPSYLGADPTTRLVFIGTMETGGANAPGGIYRLDDTELKLLKKATTGIKSVAYNAAATKLVAGESGSNIVWRSANPLATSPTVTATSTYKRSGVDLKTIGVIVAWSGTNVFAGSGGTDGGFSISKNDGATFNDISLVKTAMTNIADVAISPDGTTRYLLTNDGVDMSLWRYVTAWERVRAFTPTSLNYIVRVAPDDANVVYLAETGTNTIWQSTDGGETKWTLRYSAVNIQDLAVESASVIYVTEAGTANIIKSTNGGFLWSDTPVATKLAGGNNYRLASIARDQLIVGSTTGYVAYSTDGGTTWTAISTIAETGATNIQITADKLTAGGFIYVSSGTAAGNVVRWKIDPATTSWTDIISGTVIGQSSGLSLSGGVLYALSYDTTTNTSYLYRQLAPSTATSTTVWNDTVSSAMTLFNIMPQALKRGAGKLWAVNTQPTIDTLFSCQFAFPWTPWASDILVTPASLNLGLFTSENTTASGNLTFVNTDGIPHQVSLSANLTDVIGSGNYSANVTFSSSNFTALASGMTNISLSINLTSLPASIYSGKVMATVDGGASRSIHAIFGFAKVREVTVHKIDINGAPAQGHPLWVLMESPFQSMFRSGVYTDASGNFTFYAPDGNYHLLSPNWGHAANQTTIWTIAENVTISSDMTITLDERDTRLVDFNPNKAGQVAASKASMLYYEGRYGWASSWWYPGSFLTRVSPIYRFNAGFSYNYYPRADFNTGQPQGEWHNLLYSTENITTNTTFVADYSNLVHRFTEYGVALPAPYGERATWAQWALDDISWWGLSFNYPMDAPQQRWEWLSPYPVRYGQSYAKDNPWGEWYFYNYTNYSPGEYKWRIGGQPLSSGVDTWIGWGGTDNYLYINGPISRDSSGSRFYNQQAKYSGKIKVTQNSDNVVLETDIWDSFWQRLKFAGSANFTVEVWGKAPLQLSGGSYTRLDFTANQTGDSRPPQLLFQVPGINLFGVTLAGEVKVRVQATDDSQIDSVRLNYSLDDGDNWTAAGLPTLAEGWYTFDLGQLQDTFVTIAVDATDVYGNHIHRNTNRAFYVGGPGVQVSVNAPSKVIPTGNFTATININQVENLDAANYDVSFDPTVLAITIPLPSFNATQMYGRINGTTIPVDIVNLIHAGSGPADPTVIRLVQNVSGLSGVSGSGYLAKLHFRVIGSPGQNSNISLSGGMLNDNETNSIPATWIGDSVDTSGIVGDATQDGIIDSRDITKVERIVAGLDPRVPGADANWDGNINARDITKVERLIAGLDPPFGAPQYGGVLNMVWTSAPTGFDEAFVPISRAPTLHLTNEELLAGDWAKGPAGTHEATWLYSKFPTPQTLTGSLAESWEISGNQTLIFHIRKGVRFHDKPPTSGREMTAYDVVFSLKRLWETAPGYHYQNYPWQDYFEALDGGPWIKALDNYTVEIKSLPGKLAPVYEIAGDFAKIVPPEVVNTYGDMQDWRNASGTGPFMLTDYTTNASSTFVRNPLYWMKDPLHPENRLPYLDGVKYFIIPDTSTQRAALRTGQIDWLGDISAWDAEGFAITNPELHYLRYLPAQTMTLFMRTDNITLVYDEIRVRWALSLAIDRQAIKNQYYGGNAEILTSPIAPVTDFMDMYTALADLPVSARELYEYDPERAKMLLAEAGYPNGFKTEVIVNGASPADIDLASITKAYWAAIGVDLTLNIKTTPVYMAIGAAKTYTNMYMRSMLSRRPFDFFYWKPGAQSNYSMINDSYLNEIIAAIDASYFNESYRRQLMKDVVPYVLEQSWMLPMPEPYVYTFWQPWVKGYHGELTVGNSNLYFPKYIWINRN